MKVVLVACVLGACGYEPAFVDCAVACTAVTGCPDDLRCGDEGLCRSAGASGACQRTIAWRATTTQTIAGGTSETAVTIASPLATNGDVLIATIAMGSVGETAAPTFGAPPGWTLVRQIDKDLDSALAVYWHAFGTAEPASHTWTFNQAEQGVAWISSYSGASATSPIDVEAGDLDVTLGTSYALPPLTTTVAGAMIVGVYAGHDAGTPATWTGPNDLTPRANLNNAITRSGLGVDTLLGAAGATPAYVATVSTPQEYTLVHVLALRPVR